MALFDVRKADTWRQLLSHIVVAVLNNFLRRCWNTLRKAHFNLEHFLTLHEGIDHKAVSGAFLLDTGKPLLAVLCKLRSICSSSPTGAFVPHKLINWNVLDTF